MQRSRLIPYLAILALGVAIGGTAAWVVDGHKSSPAIAGATKPPRQTAPTVPPAEGIVFGTTSQPPPVTPDLLPSGVPIVYAFYFFGDLARVPVSKVVWRRDGKALGVVPRADVQPEPSRSGSGRVLLRAPGGKLATGIYEVEIQTDRRRFRANFVVADGAAAIMSQQAPAEAALAVDRPGTARGTTPGGEPAQPTSKFGTSERVYFVFRYRAAEPGMAVGVKWWSGKIELKNARREIVLPAESGWAHAWIQAESGLPPGAYLATVTSSGDAAELARSEFTIQ